MSTTPASVPPKLPGNQTGADSTHSRSDGEPVHSVRTLFAELATLVRNTCRAPEHPATFDILTTPTPLQRRAFELVEQIST